MADRRPYDSDIAPEKGASHLSGRAQPTKPGAQVRLLPGYERQDPGV